MSVFGWIIFQQNSGFDYENFEYWNLPWADYKAGFGSIDGNFWLGLEKVHLLTSSQPYRMRMEMQDGADELWFSAEYWLFKIGEELNDKYRLEVDGYSGDAGNSLMYEGDYANDGCFGCYIHNGMEFATYDQDNDLKVGENCADFLGGGWWYNKCHWACLNLNMAPEWRPYFAALQSRMMIKPQ